MSSKQEGTVYCKHKSLHDLKHRLLKSEIKTWLK